MREQLPDMRMLVTTLLALCWLAGGSAQSQTRLHASYEAYAAGLNVASIDAGFLLEPNLYRIALTYKLRWSPFFGSPALYVEARNRLERIKL